MRNIMLSFPRGKAIGKLLFTFAFLNLVLLFNLNSTGAVETEPSHPPPAPNNLSSEAEQVRAQQAMQAELTKYLNYWGPRYQATLGEVAVEGEWAYGIASWQSEFQTTSGPIHILARRLPDDTWQALLSVSDILYYQWLKYVPEDLILIGMKHPSYPYEATNLIIISDEQFVSGNPRGEVEVQQFLSEYTSPLIQIELEPIEGLSISSGSALAFLGEAYSVSPSVLLTFAEIRYGILNHLPTDEGNEPITDANQQEISAWLRDTAKILSEGFYEYYYGFPLGYYTLPSGEQVPISAGNASTYALHKYFAVQSQNIDEWQNAIAFQENLFITTYESLFGSTLQGKLKATHPSASDLMLPLPTLKIPWEGGDTWNYTGGPHNFNGSGDYPLSGVDYQPVGYSGCSPPVASDRWIAASATGRTVDYQENWLKLDHDQDGNVNTGWLTVYGHIANRIGDNQTVQQGDLIGNPSCYGGIATGVHLHFGIKFENIWQPIAGTTLSGWVIENGQVAYHGYMTKSGEIQRQSCYRPGGIFNCATAAVTSDNNGGGGDPSCPTVSGRIQLYDLTNCDGDSVFAETPGLYNTGNFNDRTESIAVADNWSTKLYLHDNESSPSICITATDSNLWDNTFSDGTVVANQTTWFRVYDNNNCSGGAVSEVRLYDQTNYSDPHVFLTTPGLYMLEGALGFNDKTESIQIPSGWAARLYLHDNESSPGICITTNDSDLWNNTFSDGTVVANQTTWVRVYDNTSCSGGSTSEVSLYDGTTYSPPYISVSSPDLYDLTGVFNFNDKAESIQMPSGWSVRLFEHNDYYGPEICIHSNDSNLWDNYYNGSGNVVANSATWFEVYGQSDCPSISTPPAPPNLQSPGNGAYFNETNGASLKKREVRLSC